MELSEIYLVCIVMMVLCCIIDLMLCIVTIYQLYIKQSCIIISNSFKKLTIITMIAYTLCTIGDIAQVIIRYEYYLPSALWHHNEAYLSGTVDFIYYTGNVTFFILLFMRIRKSFQVSKSIMYYLSLLLLISIICCIAWCFIVIYFSDTTGVILEYYIAIDSWPLSIDDFLLNLSLFILFIHKIKNKDSMEGIEVADDVSSFGTDDEYNDKSKVIIWNVMIKHCVLFGISLFLNQVWYLANIINALATTESITNFSLLLIKDYTARSVENLINIIILWLVLKINNDKYVYLCKCWHSFILKYCMKEDPNNIREGFVVDEDETREMFDKNKVEGKNLIVTERNNSEKNKVEGHYVLLTR